MIRPLIDHEELTKILVVICTNWLFHATEEIIVGHFCQIIATVEATSRVLVSICARFRRTPSFIVLYVAWNNMYEVIDKKSLDVCALLLEPVGRHGRIVEIDHVVLSSMKD